jgi:hypothetical protein
MILTPHRFRSIFLRGLVAKRETRANHLEFNQNVISPFGWAAKKEKNERRIALEKASAFYNNDTYLLHVLLGMKNTWPKIETHKEFSKIVKSDYEWFARTYINSVSFY